VTVPLETAVDSNQPDLIPLDKWRHFVAYAVLGIVLPYATADWSLKTRFFAVGVVGTTILYRLDIEFSQSLTPRWYFSVDGAYANTFGGELVTPWYLVQRSLAFVPIASIVFDIVDHRSGHGLRGARGEEG